MRYAWAQQKIYRESLGWPRLALQTFSPYLRSWDLRSARHVDYFLANSRNVAKRIQQTYHRQAEVVYPPIDTEFFTPGSETREDFYLMVTALSPYKRVDQALEAFGRLGRELRIIGTGQQLSKLRRGAPRNVKFLGWQSNQVVRDCYRRCRALVFPGEEDFGIVPLEAMACGTAVIAYGAGGALESVVDFEQADPNRASGLLYAPQTAESLARAVKRFEQIENCFVPEHMVGWARGFSTGIFLENFKRVVGPILEEEGLSKPW